MEDDDDNAGGAHTLAQPLSGSLRKDSQGRCLPLFMARADQGSLTPG